MKKIYCFAIALTLMLSVSAQNQIRKAELGDKSNAVKIFDRNTAKDTLLMGDVYFFDNSIEGYYSGWGYNSSGVKQGYIYGSNTDGSTFAMGFINTEPIGVIGAQIWHGFIDTTSAATSGNCDISIQAAYIDGYSALYYLDGTDTVTIECECPQSVFTETTYNLREVDTVRYEYVYEEGVVVDSIIHNGWNDVFFAEPYYVEGDFALIWNADACTQVNDTVTVVSSDGAPEVDNYLWMNIALGSGDNAWIKMSDNFSGGAGTPALFAIIDDAFVGINDEGKFFQNYQMSFYPNPATDNLNVEYALKNDAKTNVVITTLSGQVVYQSNTEMRTAGTVYSNNINVNNLASGTYLISVGNDSKRLVKKLVIK